MRRDYASAAALVEGLASRVVEVSDELELSPADVARETGLPVETVLRLIDGPSYRTPVALLRWLDAHDPASAS